ncbi:hypothetical protein CFB41_14330 [Burkholderia sp. AU33803]|nr:hypothetical protein CFB41_14330 [Burkholderia sp. AU33803]PRD87501.1 hypothetical protein C6P88_28935 [Burkholderia contaminans]
MAMATIQMVQFLLMAVIPLSKSMVVWCMTKQSQQIDLALLLIVAGLRLIFYALLYQCPHIVQLVKLK